MAGPVAAMVRVGASGAEALGLRAASVGLLSGGGLPRALSYAFSRQPGCCVSRKQTKNFSRAPGLDGRDDYQVLGVSPGASKDEVKKAYRREALKWHPDRHDGPGKQEAEAKFKRISEAYSNITSGRGRVGGSRGSPTGGGFSHQRARRSGGGGATYNYQYTYPRGGGGGFTRGEADKIFEEFFGSGAAQHILKEMENLFRNQHRHGGGGPFVFRGGMPGMSPEEFRRIFEHQERARSRGQDGSYDETKRETFVSREGVRMERRTTTRKDRDGRVISKMVEETRAPLGGDAASGQPRASEPSPLAQLFSRVATQVFFRVFVPVIVRTVQGLISNLFGGRRIK